ncbi:hypothetical protein HNQ77_000059 [Silvibacterium bohemicum]|uniref:Uncharacterized protein n=1 Tax=Silvibacterium bohemicum TaxID=1577686 RepID=A0A841JT54_9BACT|nr:hypothetical protein [Silvibacterium bohemicum]
MSKADEVIRYVRRTYVEPALEGGHRIIKIRAGDVHKALQLNNRVPSVCQALLSQRFLDQNSLELVEKHGPPSGSSTTMVFTYRLHRDAKSSTSRNGHSGSDSQPSLLLSLRGAGKELFAKLGGGETLLQEERRRWNTDTAPLSRRKA